MTREEAKMTDLISRADAIEAVTKLCVDGYIAKVDGYFIPLTDALINTLSALPSADCIEFDFNKYQPRVRNNVKDGIPSADAVPQLKQTDTLIIADALRYLAQDTERHLADRTRADALRQKFLKYGARMKGGDTE